MPDRSCYNCYECSNIFNLINRRHHCRMCGKIFCGKCAANFIPYRSRSITGSASSCDDSAGHNKENSNRVRVCRFCFKQWEEDIAKQRKVCASSTCSSTIISAATNSSSNSSYEGLDGLPRFFENDLPDQHFAGDARSFTESSPRKPFEDISYNNQDFGRSESEMTANEEKGTYSSDRYGLLGTRYILVLIYYMVPYIIFLNKTQFTTDAYHLGVKMTGASPQSKG
jgi:FYVE zinc finger